MNELPSEAAQPSMPDDARAGRPHAPGAWLAAARQEHGLTVEQVASQLNLAPRQVAALESDNYAALPGMVIVRGFLRAYAKLLKIDPVPLLAMLADSAPAVTAAPARQVSASDFSQSRMPAMHAKQDRAVKAPVVALLAVVAVAAGASYVLGWWPDALSRRFGQFRGAVVAGVGGVSQPAAVDANDAARAADAGSAIGSASAVSRDGPADVAGNVAAPSGTVAATGAAANTVATTSVASGEPALTSSTTLANPAAALASSRTASTGLPANTAAPAAAAPAANPLVLHVQQDSWIELRRANNTAIVSRLAKAGSVETFDITQPVTLIVGNLAGVEASLRGAPLALDNGAKGNVAKIRIE